MPVVIVLQMFITNCLASFESLVRNYVATFISRVDNSLSREIVSNVISTSNQWSAYTNIQSQCGGLVIELITSLRGNNNDYIYSLYFVHELHGGNNNSE